MTPPRWNPREPTFWAAIVTLASVYFVLAKIGLLVSVARPTLIWLPTGLSLAVLILWGRSLWPGVALGALVETLSTGAPLAFAVGTGLAATAGALVGCEVLDRLDFRLALTRVRDVLALVLAGALASTLVSTTLGILSRCVVDPGRCGQVAGRWWVWWGGEAIGVLIVASAILTWTGAKRRLWTSRRIGEWAMTAAALMAISVVAFTDLVASVARHMPVVYLPIFLLIWAAFRYGPPAVSGGTLIVVAIAAWGTSRGQGPFVQSSPDVYLRLLWVWVFANVLLVTTLLLAAVIAERERSVRDSLGHRDFASQIMTALGQGVVVSDVEGRLEFVNPAFARLVGRKVEDLIGQTRRDLVHPEDASVHERERTRRLMGETTTFPSRLVRPDGSVVYVLVTSAPRWEEDHVAGSITVVTDVTDQKEREHALEQSEERYRRLVELSPEPIVVHHDFVITFANAAAARLLGVPTSDELVGRHLRDFVHDDSEEAYHVRVSEIESGIEPDQRVAFRLTRVDGGTRHVEISSSPVDFIGQSARQILLRDVTEQRRAEHALRDAHEALGRAHSQLAAIIDNSPLVAIQGYSADGRVLFWNRASEDLYGFSAEQVIGHRLTGLILDADDGEAFEELVADICQTKQSAPPREWTTVTASGEQRFVLSSIFPVQVGSNRHATQVVCMDVDITERRRAEEAMRESEAQLRTIVDYAPEAMVILDVDLGRFVEMNERAVRLLGRSRDELLRCGPADVSPENQPGGRPSTEMSAEMVHAAMNGEAPVFEWTHQDADGHEIPTEVHLVRLPAAGRRLVRGSITDITERRRLEEQLLQSQKMEAIGRLAGGIAHDFNNLTTAILGYGEMALEGMAPDDPFRVNIEQIEHAARRAADLTRQLLAFARKQVIEPKVILLNELVRNIEEMLRRLIGEDVELVTNLMPELAAVRVDPGQFEQVLVNLAVNARDAMPAGGRLTVVTMNVEDGAWPSDEPPPAGAGQYVAVRVTDTGVGMNHDVLGRIFEPFFTTKARTKGTGLGLSTCYGIVKQAGGDILVESEPGRGTTFWIYLPRSEQPAVSLTRPRREPSVTVGAETILLVEDEPMVMDMVDKILRRSGYNVLTGESGEEALAVVEAYDGEIDLLVTDVVMPRMSGGQLARILCERQPGLKVLYMSGYTEDQVGPHGQLGDSASFLQKPFQARDLAERVRSMLDATTQPVTGSEP